MSKLLVGILISLMSVSTMASGYIKGGLGMSFGGELDLEHTLGSATDSQKTDLESGIFFAGAYGMQLSPMLDLEFELSYRMNDLKEDDDKFKALNVAVNGIFNYPVEGLPVTPYFGGGLALGMHSSDVVDSEFGVSLQFLGGVNYAINERMSISTDLRYLISIIDPEFKDDDGVKTKTTYSHLGLLVALKYSL